MTEKIIIIKDEKYTEHPADKPLDIVDFGESSYIYNPTSRTINDVSITPYVIANIDNLDFLLIGDNSKYYLYNENGFIHISSDNTADLYSDIIDCDIVIANKEIEIITGYVFINGVRHICGRYNLNVGDVVLINNIYIVIKDKYIQCYGEGYETTLNICIDVPKKYEEFPVYKRSPRIIKKQPEDTIDVLEPSAKPKKNKGGIAKLIIPPLCTMCIMAGVSILMKRGIFVVVSVAGTLMTTIFSVTTYINDKKEDKKNESERKANYQQYLLDLRKKLYEKINLQKEAILFHNPSTKEIEFMIRNYSSRLYERSENDADFLTFVVGYANMLPSFKVKYKNDALDNDKDELRLEMKEIADSYNVVKDMPVIIDLKKSHLGIVGDKEKVHAELFALLTQMCFFQSYLDIEVITLVDEKDKDKFEWIKWYPHCKVKSINISGLISGENQRDQVLGNIAQVLKFRKQRKEEQTKSGIFLPYYIFIIDSPKLVINHSIMEYLQDDQTGMGFCVIYTTNIQSNLPENIKTIVVLDSKQNSTLFMNEGVLTKKPMLSINVDGVDLEGMSRRLAPIIHSKGVSTQIPDSITFFEMFGVKAPEQLPVAKLWSQNSSYKSLAVPLGVRAKDDYVYLDLHEKAHGPHGLVAGTTGSGKSEILQSYILSLAVNFHPYEVGFLLIDYKGGGMANLFNKLPHLLGTITNLDGSESMRALASIKSELARRQRVFNENGVNNINQYTKLFKAGKAKMPLPHLFLISDEFAELKKEQPDFMTELVSAARIGRSLGVHLILATQKPSGVVDDQIWSNSKFKLALKVQDEADSKEVLKTGDAAKITQVGRAILQVGNNEIYEMFQSAWSGATYSQDEVKRGFDNRVYLINNLGQGTLLNKDLSESEEENVSKITQLDCVVDYIAKVYSQMNTIPIEKPWLPPLEAAICSPKLNSKFFSLECTKPELLCPIGVIDIPEKQMQTEFIHDFMNDGNLAIFGAPGFGKSTVLMTVLLTLASQNSSSLVNYYLLDLGNASLISLRSLPHTADYLSFDDEEKLKKLIKLLSSEIKSRKLLFSKINAMNFKMYNTMSDKPLPAIIVVIDNYDVVKEIGLELEEFITKLTRDGLGLGIYTVITASRSNSVRYSVLNNFKNKIVQFMFDNSEITSIIGRSNYKIPEIKGRALIKVKDINTMQCYLPVTSDSDTEFIQNINALITRISSFNFAPKAVGIRMLPDILSLNQLNTIAEDKEKAVSVGLDTEEVEVQYVNLNNPVFLIVGTPQTGKTNFLKLIISRSKAEKIFISDSQALDLETMVTDDMVYLNNAGPEAFCSSLVSSITKRKELYANSDMSLRPREFYGSLPAEIIVIDDVDRFIELSKPVSQKMEDAIKQATECGICIFATTIPSKMRGYDNITKLIKDTGMGMVFGNPVEQSIFSFMPPRGYHQNIDMGFLFTRGDYKIIKLPMADDRIKVDIK